MTSATTATAMDGDSLPWWARPSWPTAPATRGACRFIPTGRFEGRAWQLCAGEDRAGAICLDGTWRRSRDLHLPGGDWFKLRLQLHGRTRLSLGGRRNIDTSRPAMVLVRHARDDLKQQHDGEGTPDCAIILRFPLRSDDLPEGYCAETEGTLRETISRIRRAPQLVEMPLTAELSRRCIRLLRQLAHNDDAPDRDIPLTQHNELAACALDHMQALLGRPDNAKLSSADRRRVAAARDLIEAYIESGGNGTFDLAQLPRRVGLNRNKLNRGFHALFGSSAKHYLRRRRLEWARQLIVRGDMPLAAVAALTGFRYVSNFSNAYRAFHGVNPSREPSPR